MSDAADGCFKKDEDLDKRSCLEPLGPRKRERAEWEGGVARKKRRRAMSHEFLCGHKDVSPAKVSYCQAW